MRRALIAILAAAALTAIALSVTSVRRMGVQPDGSIIVPTGQTITPAGAHIDVAGCWWPTPTATPFRSSARRPTA